MASDLGGRYAFDQTGFRPGDLVKTEAPPRESATTKGGILAPAAITSRIENEEGPGQGNDPALDRALLRRRGDFHGPQINAVGWHRVAFALYKINSYNRMHDQFAEPNARETVLSSA